jgi:L-alanine-DL-glutamate epimerase-like enolase superfamily enzyme
MRIAHIETFILHVPVTNLQIADSTHRVTHWGAVGVIVHTDSAVRGYGYTGTHGHLATDRLIRDCIAEAFAPLLVGEDPSEVGRIWQKLYHSPSIRWVGRAGIVQMALSAIDVALWDIKTKAAEMPLWKYLGGDGRKRLLAYNTDGGWLNWTRKQLVECARAAVGEGFHGIKLKVGSPDPADDLARIAAVREAIDQPVRLMIDANGRWDLPTATRFGRQLDAFDVFWFEEPMWFDDIGGHAALGRAIHTPIALGEQQYSLDAFRALISAGAVHYVQPDATRVGGISGWLQVADLAMAHRLPVVAHAGDMMQIHQHVSLVHPACDMLEYIPWLRACFEEPATVEEGFLKIPQLPGAGTTLRNDAIDRFGVG